MQSMTAKTIFVKSDILNSVFNSISSIAKNSLNSEDRLINFMCNNRHVVIMASDSSVEGMMQLNLNCNIVDVFAVSFDKMKDILHEGEDIKITLKDDHIVVDKSYCTVRINREKVNCKPFINPEPDETVDGSQFTQTIKSLRKHLTNQLDDTSVIIMNKEYAYTRNRLFYVISDFKTNNQYVFNKFGSYLIPSIFNRDVLSLKPKINITISHEEGKIILFNDICSIKLPLMRSNPIDLTSFAKIRNVNGYIAKKPNLLRCLQELNSVEPTTEIDVVGKDKTITLSPKKEGTFTNFNIPAEQFVITDGPIDFGFTVSTEAFVSMIKGSVDETLLFSQGSETMLVMINRSDNIGLRYYMSVI